LACLPDLASLLNLPNADEYKSFAGLTLQNVAKKSSSFIHSISGLIMPTRKSSPLYFRK
jgi:hypothetical protein